MSASSLSLPLAYLFPYAERRNIALFYVQTICANAFFATATWLFFWLQLISLETVGVLDWIAVILAWLAEVPSGVLADRIGRKRLVVLALALIGSGALLTGFAGGWLLLFLGNTLNLVGYSFYSGAGEALAYESLRDLPDQVPAYERVISAATALSAISMATATSLGALVYTWHPGAPHIVHGVLATIGALVSLRATETLRSTHSTPTRRSLRTAVALSSRSFTLISRPLIPAALVTISAISLYDMQAWSFLRTAIAQKGGLEILQLTITMNIAALMAAVVPRAVPAIRHRLGDGAGFPLLGALLGALFCSCGLPLNQISTAAALITISCIAHILHPWLSLIVNQHTQDSERATSISLFSFLQRVQFLCLALVLPILAVHGYLGVSLYILGGLTILACVGAYMMRGGRDATRSGFTD